jgi:hypothetical protein
MAKEFKVDDGILMKKSSNVSKRPQSYSALMKGRSPLGDLTQEYKEAISAGRYDSAMETFVRIAKNANNVTLTTYAHDAMSHMPTLRMKEEVARKAFGDTLPPETIALLLHYWCQQTYDSRTRDDNIRRLCWEGTKSTSLTDILQYENILSFDERSLVSSVRINRLVGQKVETI